LGELELCNPLNHAWSSGNIRDSIRELTGQSVTWNCVPMSLVIGISGAGFSSQIWGLANPASGNNTLVIPWTGGQKVFAAAISFTGVDQSTPFPHTASANSVATVNVTSATGNKVVACESSGSGQGTASNHLR
jgi:hypothetical protein